MNRAEYIDIENGEATETKTTGVVKYLTVAGSLAAVGLLAYSSVTSGSAPTATSSSMTNMMTVTRPDVPEYGAMADDAKLRLFEDFVQKFSRKVILFFVCFSEADFLF